MSMVFTPFQILNSLSILLLFCNNLSLAKTNFIHFPLSRTPSFYTHCKAWNCILQRKWLTSSWSYWYVKLFDQLYLILAFQPKISQLDVFDRLPWICGMVNKIYFGFLSYCFVYPHETRHFLVIGWLLMSTIWSRFLLLMRLLLP